MILRLLKETLTAFCSTFCLFLIGDVPGLYPLRVHRIGPGTDQVQTGYGAGRVQTKKSDSARMHSYLYMKKRWFVLEIFVSLPSILLTP